MNNMNINDFISMQLAKPVTHVVVTTYAGGRTSKRETRSAGAAENYATGERRKIGRDLIDRTSGKTVQVISVDIFPIDGV